MHCVWKKERKKDDSYVMECEEWSNAEKMHLMLVYIFFWFSHTALKRERKLLKKECYWDREKKQ